MNLIFQRVANVILVGSMECYGDRLLTHGRLGVVAASYGNDYSVNPKRARQKRWTFIRREDKVSTGIWW